MSGAVIAQLLVQFGPAAFDLIRNLTTIFTKETLTVEEVLAFCDKSQKSYDTYISEAQQAKLKL